MMALMSNDECGAEMRDYFRTMALTSGSSKSYAHLLTAVLKQLHHSKFNHEYDVHGICNPFLQVKVRSPLCRSISSATPFSRSRCALLPGLRRTAFATPLNGCRCSHASASSAASLRTAAQRRLPRSCHSQR